MDIEFQRDNEGTKFAKVTERLQDKNGIPIGTQHDNPILDTRVYEVEYLDRNKGITSCEYYY